MSTPKKQQRFYLQPVSLACMVLVALTASNLAAAPITLSQQPAGNGGREPAPNIVLSIDDSGSMGWDVNGCQTADWNVPTYGNQHEPGSTGCGPVGTISTNPSRISALRSALRAQFGDGTANSGLLTDDRIRLAWQAMHNNGSATDAGSLTAGNTNSMKRFSGTHRTNFNSFIASLAPNNGTPSHKMMSQAYNYMKSGASSNSPWASNPGTTELPYLACRRSYHIFMTDGAWNSAETRRQVNGIWTFASNFSIGNQDGSDITLPSPAASLNLSPTPPTLYNGASTTNNQIRVYRDGYGGNAGSNVPSTLADYAFRSWAEDLQPSIDNAIKPLIKQSGSETIGTTSLDEFWNPKNDPATWQHLTQHTIGFGNSAVNWTGNPLWNTPANASDSTYGGGYSDLVNGTATWQNPIPWVANNSDTNTARQSELWHAALNGRGKFYPARNDAALTVAFSDILNNILNDTSKPLVSIAANSSTLKAGVNAYIAGYDANTWAGKLVAYPVNSTTGVIATTAAWNAAALLDNAAFSVANRFVASYDGSASAGIEWKTYSNLPTLQQTPLSKNSTGTVDNNGQNRVDYLRGDRSKEASKTGGIFRNRSSRLGDIVNSNIVYVDKPASDYGDAAYATFKGTSTTGVGGRPPMIYVGANDGMLHGFDAATGTEKLAYIPQGVAQGDLRKLTDTTYTHQYFVDGTPFTSDAKVGSLAVAPVWRTVLVSGLGAGGKGYVALDASNPTNFTATNASNLVIADTTASTDADIGNMFITPAMDDFIAGKSDQIVRLNSNNTAKHRWALVLGNGYNSGSEAPVLVIQYLDGAREIKKISPCTQPISTTACSYKTGNGLSTPRLVDLNSDGVADVAYAGDLLGNVWKFDLSSVNDSDWTTSFSKAPLFRAKPGQAFTTAPYVASNDAAFGVIVHISSGKNLTTADQSSTGTETTYALWDNSTFGQVAVTPATTPPSTKFKITDSTPINSTSSATLPATMVQQTISASTFVDGGVTYYTSTSNPVDYKSASPKRGWFMDWTVQGQRVLRNSKSFDGQKISIYSTVPNSATGSSNVETCTPGTTGERSFLTVLNLFSGNPSQSKVFDLTTSAANSNPNTTGFESNPAGDTIELRNLGGGGVKIIPPCPEGQVCAPPKELKFGKYVGARANWREKQ
jgi:type IV pilus assembly protein PilY1